MWQLPSMSWRKGLPENKKMKGENDEFDKMS